MFTFFVNHIIGDLPSWLWPFVAGVGVGCYFLAGIGLHFPNVKPYAMFARPVSFVLFVLGVFMYGGAGVAEVYKQSIDEAKQQAAIQAQQSTDANNAINTETRTSVKVIHDTQIVYRDRVTQEAKKLDSECVLDKDAIAILNGAAKDPLRSTK